MILNDFRKAHQRYQIEKPKLFLLAEPDPPATAEQLSSVEREIGVKLPSEYRGFLSEFGGGTFGFTNIFSLNPDSEYYLPSRREEASSYLPSDLLPFSDDFSGGLYVFKVKDREAQKSVYYWNSDGGLVETKFADVFEFVARYAYEPA
jgi:hypothetical protein